MCVTERVHTDRLANPIYRALQRSCLILSAAINTSLASIVRTPDRVATLKPTMYSVVIATLPLGLRAKCYH